MTQVSKYPLKKDVSKRVMDVFIQTLINIKRNDEAEELMIDFLTPTERIMLSKRFSIALLLERGYGYKTIKDVLKVSSGTIAQVNTARQNGSSGYKKFIKKILADEVVTEFISQSLVDILSIPAGISRGTSVWKEIHKKARQIKESKEVPF